MGLLPVIVWIALTAGRPQPADVNWTATVPLWTSLSPHGKVIDAGPGPRWASPPPAARIGALPPMRADAEPAPAPRPLPPLANGPALPPGTPIARLTISSPDSVPIRVVPEPISPPLAAQATHPRPRRPMSPPVADRHVVPTSGVADHAPAARLGAPSR